MRVLLSTYGSRGDVQPLAGLAVALQALGAEALVCAPPDVEFTDLLDRARVPFAPAFASVHEWIEMAKHSGLNLPQLAARMVPAQFDAIAAAAEGCDAIVATGLFPSVAAAQTVAEKMDIRFVWTAFCPLILPSPHHRPMEYGLNVRAGAGEIRASCAPPRIGNRLLNGRRILQVVTAVLGYSTAVVAANEFRAGRSAADARPFWSGGAMRTKPCITGNWRVLSWRVVFIDGMCSCWQPGQWQSADQWRMRAIHQRRRGY
jgi:hypothetical protein